MMMMLSLYESVIGLLFVAGILYGPLHSKEAVEAFKNTVAEAQDLGGKIEYGGNVSNVGLL